MFGIPTILSTLVLAALPTSSDSTLLFLVTPDCAQCQQVTPLILDLQRQGYPVQTVDAVVQPEVVKHLGVDSFPTFLMFTDGKIVDRVVGGGDPMVMKPRILRMFDSAAEHRRRVASQQSSPIVPAIASSSVAVPFAPIASQWEQTAQPAVVPAVFMQPTESVSPASDDTEFSLLSSSVKLRVDDDQGHSWGTGTIIDTRNGEALILTCGHIFRESQGRGKIDVHLFNKNSVIRVDGQCLYYDLDLDLALVYIIPLSPVRAIPVAPATYQVRAGQRVQSVGCDGGADPTVREHQILSTDRIGRPSNAPAPFHYIHYIQISGAPVGGRSGGGLFGEDGYLLGVCTTADPVENDGHFVPSHIIRHFLKQHRLSAVYEAPSLVDQNPIYRDPKPAMVAAAASNATSLQPLKPLSIPNSNSPLLEFQTPNQSEGLNKREQATLDEIKRRTQDGDEVILIVKSRRNPEAPSEVILLNGMSDQFIDALARQPKSSGTYNPVILSSPLPTPGAVQVTHPVLH